jgi:hypothetical protein
MYWNEYLPADVRVSYYATMFADKLIGPAAGAPLGLPHPPMGSASEN